MSETGYLQYFACWASMVKIEITTIGQLSINKEVQHYL